MSNTIAQIPPTFSVYTQMKIADAESNTVVDELCMNGKPADTWNPQFEKLRLTRKDCRLLLYICSRCISEIPLCVFTFLNMAPKYS
jgi:hypothetical protein